MGKEEDSRQGRTLFTKLLSQPYNPLENKQSSRSHHFGHRENHTKDVNGKGKSALDGAYGITYKGRHQDCFLRCVSPSIKRDCSLSMSRTRHDAILQCWQYNEQDRLFLQTWYQLYFYPNIEKMITFSIAVSDGIR